MDHSFFCSGLAKAGKLWTLQQLLRKNHCHEITSSDALKFCPSWCPRRLPKDHAITPIVQCSGSGAGVGSIWVWNLIVVSAVNNKPIGCSPWIIILSIRELDARSSVPGRVILYIRRVNENDRRGLIAGMPFTSELARKCNSSQRIRLSVIGNRVIIGRQRILPVSV